jgi:uncharacterized protein YjbJ (UPF0337 family)
MNKDTVKGTMDDAAGRAKRQVGEWTGNTDMQVDGAAQQVKGKVEKAVGNVKDAAKDAAKDARTDADRERQRNIEAERDRAREHVGSSDTPRRDSQGH